MKDLQTSPSAGRIGQSFQRGLTTYHAAATHQAAIAERLVDVLISAGASKKFIRSFEFGAGTGHLTQALTKRLSLGDLSVNDLVPECAAFAPSNAKFQSGPIDQIDLPQRLCLVCSSSTVQWVPDLKQTLIRLETALAPQGWLALSGFGTAQFHELRSLGSTAAAPSYVDAEAWRDLLPNNLKLKHLSQARRVEWFPNALALLRHLRDTGVNGAASETWSRAKLAQFETDYRARFGTAQGLPLTYDPVWVIAQKSG